MFETNYQREKGITTEQSLQEIEVGYSRGDVSASRLYPFCVIVSPRVGVTPSQSYCQQGYASGQQGELAGCMLHAGVNFFADDFA